MENEARDSLDNNPDLYSNDDLIETIPRAYYMFENESLIIYDTDGFYKGTVNWPAGSENLPTNAIAWKWLSNDHENIVADQSMTSAHLISTKRVHLEGTQTKFTKLINLLKRIIKYWSKSICKRKII